MFKVVSTTSMLNSHTQNQTKTNETNNQSCEQRIYFASMVSAWPEMFFNIELTVIIGVPSPGFCGKVLYTLASLKLQSIRRDSKISIKCVVVLKNARNSEQV